MKRNLRITVEGGTYNVVVEEVEATAAAAPAPPARSQSAAPATVRGAIVAPLGGVVFGIDVQVAVTFAVGDRVATIEAMKMKTEMISKIADEVSSIAVKVNESVETGQILMTLA